MKNTGIILIAALLIMAAGCGAKQASETVSVSETAAPAIEITVKTEEPASADYSAFAGDYEDEYSQRAMMEAEDTGESLRIVVSWSESAFAFYRWEMNATLDGERLVYSDCVNEYIASDDNPDGEAREVLYENGTGFFEVENGKLKWTGAGDPDCRECVFSK